jgi:hypothetical protein
VAPASTDPRPLIPAALAGAIATLLAVALPVLAGLAGASSYVVGAAAFAGALGVALLVAGVLGDWDAVPAWGVSLLATAYGLIVLGEGRGVDLAAPLIGVLLVLIAELAQTACEWRGPHAVDWSVEGRRWLRLMAVAAAGALIGLAALLATSAIGAVSPLVLVVGSGAVVALLGMIVVLRGRERPPLLRSDRQQLR